MAPLIYIKPFYKPILIGNSNSWYDPNDFVNLPGGRYDAMVGSNPTFSTLESAYANLQQWAETNATCPLSELIYVVEKTLYYELYYAPILPTIGTWTITGAPESTNAPTNYCTLLRSTYSSVPEDNNIIFGYNSSSSAYTGLYRIWFNTSAVSCFEAPVPCGYGTNKWHPVNNCTNYPSNTCPGYAYFPTLLQFQAQKIHAYK